MFLVQQDSQTVCADIAYNADIHACVVTIKQLVGDQSEGFQERQANEQAWL